MGLIDAFIHSLNRYLWALTMGQGCARRWEHNSKQEKPGKHTTCTITCTTMIITVIRALSTGEIWVH